MTRLFKIIIAVCTITLLIGAITGATNYIQKHTRTVPQEPKKIPTQNITIIEGWGTQDIGDYLEKQGIVGSKNFIAFTATSTAPVTQRDFLQSKPAQQSLEGFLFPDTYEIFKKPFPTSTVDSNTISTDIVQKMLDNFGKKFTPEMREATKARHMTIYEIVTLASIIERETGRNVKTTAGKENLDKERKIIAGIFYNRLNIGMALESDATVNYITKKNTPSATYADTKIDSPYNTYKYNGLPPGPIANPSLSSLMAAIYPTSTDYLFFLHTQPEGTAIYSKTYEEHLHNKQKYLP
jgi:UPF0755 protein